MPERREPRGWEQRAEWVERFLRSDTRRFVLGCNPWAGSVARTIGVEAIIDDFVGIEVFEGTPVRRSEEIPAGSMVLSAIVGERPISANLFLRSRGFDYLDYFSFLRLSGRDTKAIPFWGGFDEDFVAHRDEYDWVRNGFADADSTETIDRIIEFRRTRDLNPMSPFTNRQAEQYFEDFIPYPQNGVFYDVGSFDGFTSKEFVRHSRNYRAIHAFEPSPSNHLKVIRGMEGFANVNVHQLLLGSREGETRIIEAGSSSRESNSEGSPVSIRTLDSLGLDAPTFMKIDIEGAELEFLEGARRTIEASRPTIAIACYHSPMHLWQIPRLVLGLFPGYEMYLRHYTEGVTETVLTFVNPDQR